MANIVRPVSVHPRAALAQAGGYYLAFVSLGLTDAALGPALPTLAAHSGTSLGIISWLFTGRAIGYLLGSLGGGRLYDRVPGHHVMAVSVLTMGLAVALVPFGPILALLLPVTVLWGLGQGSVDVGGNTLIVWIFGRSVGPFMSALHFSYGLGAFIAPIIIGAALTRFGDITGAFVAMAVLTIPVAAYLLSQPSPSNHTAPVAGDPATVDRRAVALVALFLLLNVGIEASFGGWIYSYALETRLAATAQAAYLTSGFWGALTAGRLLAIPMAARFRPHTLLAADLAGLVAGLVVILSWGGSIIALWVGAILLGLSIASIFPSTISLAERRTTITGLVTSWFLVGASLGGMIFPRLIGQLFSEFGPRAMPVTLSVAALLTVLTFVALLAAPSHRVPATKPSAGGYDEP